MKLALGWLAALALWFLAFNRAVAFLPDGDTKRAVLLVGLFLLGGVATLGATRWDGRASLVVPAGILLVLAAGELRRGVLRFTYRAAPPVASSGPTGTLLPVVTTTRLVVHRYELPVSGLPRARLRIVHLSDLHVSSRLPFDYYRDVLDRAASYDPDLVVLTGDFAWNVADLPLLRRVLSHLPQPELGTYAVLGNHDYWTEPGLVREALSGAGIALLQGRCQVLGLASSRREMRRELAAGGDVVLCGDERPWGPGPGALPHHGTVVALTHTPDNIYELSAAGAEVVLAGHIHGGQARLPGIGALVAPSRYGRRFVRGHYRVGGAHLFLSSGVGGLPLRLWCEPDILVIDLEAIP